MGLAGSSGAGKQGWAGRSPAPVRRGMRGGYMTLGRRRSGGSRRTATPRKPRVARCCRCRAGRTRP